MLCATKVYLTGLGGVCIVEIMRKKVVKKVAKKTGSRKRVTRKQSAKVATRKKEKGVPVDFTIFRSGKRVRAVAYDRRNGREVLLRDIKYVPKLMRRELTDAQIAKFLLTDDAKR